MVGSVHVSPAGVDVDTDSVTGPVNPLTAVTVMVEVPEPPGKIWAGETGPAAIVKSVTVNVTEVWWIIEPRVAATVTV